MNDLDHTDDLFTAIGEIKEKTTHYNTYYTVDIFYNNNLKKTVGILRIFLIIFQWNFVE